jgi:hydroxymethylpyrimidine kinase/phosphomethylpyrimidine kinase
VILPVALTIAGSDSGGGAGIQADLKTFAALGVHGASVLTALTAQNTVTVTAIHDVPPDFIRAQFEAVVLDLHPAAAKTGMLSTPITIATVARAIRELEVPNLVVDPVMVAKGGAKLLRDDAVAALRTELLPLATVLTPNLPEAEVLLGRRIGSLEERRVAARDLHELGPRAVVLKGGHPEADAIDVLFEGGQLTELTAERIPTSNTHGSGCTFSAAITAGLARGLSIEAAVAEAKAFITEAIRHAIAVGAGHGPVNPAWALSAGVPEPSARSGPASSGA